jgi:hypothetical protein
MEILLIIMFAPIALTLGVMLLRALLHPATLFGVLFAGALLAVALA